MASVADRKFMARALELAEKGRGKTSPNPMVGAVVVRNGKVVGEGFHRAAGKSHAEVVALKEAGDLARGATLYVTLEPCCHTGRTGPCTDVILSSGITRVVYASKDPDPRVAGKGAAELRREGIEVANGILKQETVELNEDYFTYHNLGRPFIIAKTAQTLDGKIATRSGESRWITGSQARKFAHRLRSQVDAILVGSNTVKADNPELTVRHIKGENPYRIILSSTLSFPLNSNLISKNFDYKTVIATSASSARNLARKKLAKMPIVWSLKTDKNGKIDPHDFVGRATDFGLRSILIEGGGKVIGSFLSAGLVDKMYLFTAPKLLGAGISSFPDLGIRKLKGAIQLERVSTLPCGEDIIVTGYPRLERV